VRPAPDLAFPLVQRSKGLLWNFGLGLSLVGLWTKIKICMTELSLSSRGAKPPTPESTAAGLPARANQAADETSRIREDVRGVLSKLALGKIEMDPALLSDMRETAVSLLQVLRDAAATIKALERDGVISLRRPGQPAKMREIDITEDGARLGGLRKINDDPAVHMDNAALSRKAAVSTSASERSELEKTDFIEFTEEQLAGMTARERELLILMGRLEGEPMTRRRMFELDYHAEGTEGARAQSYVVNSTKLRNRINDSAGDEVLIHKGKRAVSRTIVHKPFRFISEEGVVDVVATNEES
jgi:hypothetical protein